MLLVLSLCAALVGQDQAPRGAEQGWRELVRPAAPALRYVERVRAAEASAAPRLVLVLPPQRDEPALERAVGEVSQAAGPGTVVLACADASARLPELTSELARRHGSSSSRALLVGWGDGGRDVLRLGAIHCEHVAGVVALAPSALELGDLESLGALVNTPVALIRGKSDPREPLLAVLERLVELGGESGALDFASTCERVSVGQCEGRLRERLSQFGAAEERRAAVEAEIRALLERFHGAAARADGPAYFACLAPDAVFIGTDATERWSVPQFRAFCEPYFSRGQGWTYVARERHVQLSRDRQLAWFDERLDNANYGDVRGSGVLRLDGGRWVLTQYVLSLPVPNALAPELVRRIREGR